MFQPGAPFLPGAAGGVGPGSQQTVFPFPPFSPGPPGPGGANPFTLLAAVGGNKLPVTSGGIVGGETGATFQALLNVIKQQQHNHHQLKRRREGTKIVDFIMFKFKNTYVD